jgi:2-polyprenyl-6-hydroxyphenyl methylase / 3-demethylubiquinone-9 3-methyltransferase
MTTKPGDASKLPTGVLMDMHGGHYAQSYERKPLSRLRRLVPLFHLTGNEEVVDYACGNAMLLELLHSRVRRYVGVDFSADMLKLASARAERLAIKHSVFCLEDILAFAGRHVSQFDVAFAMDFSEHVYDEQWLDLLRAMRSTLKPGGRLYLHTPNGEYFLEILKDRGVLAQFPQHVAVRSPAHNRRLLEAAGFARVDIRQLSHYEVRQKPFSALAWLPVVGRYFLARLFITAHT